MAWYVLAVHGRISAVPTQPREELNVVRSRNYARQSNSLNTSKSSSEKALEHLADQKRLANVALYIGLYRHINAIPCYTTIPG